jgi:hypothetical protein
MVRWIEPFDNKDSYHQRIAATKKRSRDTGKSKPKDENDFEDIDDDEPPPKKRAKRTSAKKGKTNDDENDAEYTNDSEVDEKPQSAAREMKKK